MGLIGCAPGWETSAPVKLAWPVKPLRSRWPLNTRFFTASLMKLVRLVNLVKLKKLMELMRLVTSVRLDFLCSCYGTVVLGWVNEQKFLLIKIQKWRNVTSRAPVAHVAGKMCFFLRILQPKWSGYVFPSFWTKIKWGPFFRYFLGF